MKKDWIYWDSDYIKIPETQRCNCYICRKKGGVWTVKTEDSAREIPLLPEVKDIFRWYFSKHKSIMETIGSQPVAWSIVKRVARRAKIKKRIFPHVLRGTFASILAGKKFGPFTIQSTLGWKSIKTADEYIRISPHAKLREFQEKW